MYVTHDQTEALALADRVAVMQEGRIVQWGPPQDVYENPSTSFVADFMDLVNRVEGVVTLTGDEGSTVRTGNGLQVMVELGDGFKTGDAVRMAVRPDDSAIGRTPPLPDDRNAFTACVRSARFLGSSVQYQLNLGGLELIAQAPRVPPFEEGERVQVRIPADSCNVLTKD